MLSSEQVIPGISLSFPLLPPIQAVWSAPIASSLCSHKQATNNHALPHQPTNLRHPLDAFRACSPVAAGLLFVSCFVPRPLFPRVAARK